MQALKSKTIRFNIIMAGIESLHAGFQIMQPLLTQDTFILLTVAIGMVHSMGGVYLRTITDTALADK